MKIGIYFNARKHSGGVYQYSLALIEAVLLTKKHKVIIFATNRDLPSTLAKKANVRIIYLDNYPPTFWERLLGYLANTLLGMGIWAVTLERWSAGSQIRIITESHPDLMVYPTSSSLGYLIPIPSIVAIHDLQHRLNPQFPEVSANHQGRIRENNYQQIARTAKYILVDSLVGKEDVLNCYPSTDPQKIIILPFLPPSYLNPRISPVKAQKILAQYQIPDNYFYYPANFWPHKHHLDLLEALKLCHQKNQRFHLVLTGSRDVDFSTYRELSRRAQQYGLNHYLHYLGYVDSETISALYKKAIGLVMPTHFGPSNIPILEAWVMGTPVIYSNVRGCRQQLGDAGIPVTPDNPREIESAMLKLAQDSDVAKKYIVRGRSRLKLWGFADFAQRIKSLL